MPPYPSRIRPRRVKQARRKVLLVSQCDTCEVVRCSNRDLMARDELLAEQTGQEKPECRDRVKPFWEAIND